MGESFQKLNLTNAYLFAAAMQDEEICRNVLEIALNKRISKVKAHVEQVLFLDSEFKSVRFVVYASDEEEVSRWRSQWQSQWRNRWQSQWQHQE